jgi:agmatinase
MKEKIPHNFCGLETRYSDYGNSRVVLLPVPFDRTSTWMKGSRHGPRAIIDASRNLELYDIETESQVYMKGLHTARPVRARTPEKMVEKVKARTARYVAEGKFTVVLGGEHSVSIGAIEAHAEQFRSLSVLNLDAHSDRRDSYEGSRYNHACVMARVEETVDTVVSVGLRSMDWSERRLFNEKCVFFAHDCHASDRYIHEVPELLTDCVYITIDLDVLDPAIMPSTGTPEPGGLGWYEITALLNNVADSVQVVGFDVVELRPSQNRASDFLAAKLIYKLLSFILEK